MSTIASPPTLWEKFCSLPAMVKLCILRTAGREATVAFSYACPKDAPEKGMAQILLSVEPFTWFDWAVNDSEGDKRRLLWGNERLVAENVGYDGVIQNADLFPTIAQDLHSLDTLTIRGKYQPHSSGWTREITAHHRFCNFTQNIVDQTPDGVTSLELYFPVIDFLVHLLKVLREKRPNVQRVGIDLGAWIQMYPLRKTEMISKRSIESRAREEAIRTRHKLYKQEHKRLLPKWSVWFLPKASPTVPERGCSVEKSSKPDFYCSESGNQDFDQTSQTENSTKVNMGCPHTAEELQFGRPDTLSMMLRKLYQTQLDNKNIELYGLEPEEEKGSLDPISPMSFVQTPDGSGDFSCGDDLVEVFSWLAQKFKWWKPVFDWDWFMVPGTMLQNADPDLLTPTIKANWHIKSPNSGITGHKKVLQDILSAFKAMKKAGIPIHLVIGRRHRTKTPSSCYWGWPYNSESWNKWLEDEFSANLEDVAPLVDTLSIMYDLRNPLDEDRLEEIEALQPLRRPCTSCPGRLCNLKSPDDCISRNSTKGSKNDDPRNKSTPTHTHDPAKNSTPTALLALTYSGGPSTGESADDHPLDDSDTDSPCAKKNLHHLARRAAYTREALGWQRFWGKYSSSFSSLTLVRVRMPRCFDQTSSWILAALLSPAAEWKMLVHGDERASIQIPNDDIAVGTRPIEDTKDENDEEDGNENVHVCRRAEPHWPAGRFVRRTWVRSRYIWKTGMTVPSIEQVRKYILTDNGKCTSSAPRFFKVHSDYPNRNMTPFQENPIIITKEQQELDKAIQRARFAAEQEEKLEESLRDDGDEGVQSSSTRPQLPDGATTRHLAYIARRAYRKELHYFASQLSTEMQTSEHVTVSHLLVRTRRAILTAAGGPVPYDRIFTTPTRQNGQGDELAMTARPIADLEEVEEDLRAQNLASFDLSDINGGNMPDSNASSEMDSIIMQPDTSGENSNSTIPGLLDPLTVGSIPLHHPSGTKQGNGHEEDEPPQQTPSLPTHSSLLTSPPKSQENKLQLLYGESGIKRPNPSSYLSDFSLPTPTKRIKVTETHTKQTPNPKLNSKLHSCNPSITFPQKHTLSSTHSSPIKTTLLSTLTNSSNPPRCAVSEAKRDTSTRTKPAPPGHPDLKGYWKLRVVDLKAECVRRGILIKGLRRKGEIIGVLEGVDRDEER